jgi:hypothetical protein
MNLQIVVENMFIWRIVVPGGTWEGGKEGMLTGWDFNQLGNARRISGKARVNSV